MSKLAARISSKIQRQGTVSLKNETHCKQKAPDLEDEIRGHNTFAEDVAENFTQSRKVPKEKPLRFCVRLSGN